MVDRVLRQWLHPSTAKKDYPWAAVCHYVTDWKACEAGHASVRPCGVVKDKLLTMVSKARDFQNLTTVLFTDADLPGMLKKSKTKHFGESTLLKMLLSIKASPAQADAADDMDEDDDEDEADEVQEVVQVEETSDFKVVTRKSSKKAEMKAVVQQSTTDEQNGSWNRNVFLTRPTMFQAH